MRMDFGDVDALLTVVRAGGFREGARTSGRSASALSEAVRRLEERAGVRLLNRTTRSVAPTEAGERLLERVAPALAEMDAAFEALSGFRDKPAGRVALAWMIIIERINENIGVDEELIAHGVRLW